MKPINLKPAETDTRIVETACPEKRSDSREKSTAGIHMSGNIEEMARNAEKGSIRLAGASGEARNRALKAMAQALDENRDRIFAANKKDLDAADKAVREGKMKAALWDRLKITDAKLENMISGIRSVAELEDPVGKTLSTVEIDEGLTLYQISCPIGVIGVIFEARPDVVPQVMSLCLKSGNATIFKGGSEALNSNRELFNILREAVRTVPEIPEESFQLLETRDEVAQMLELDEYIDLLIPRGSNDFVRYIKDNTRIPVLGHTSGICHAYIDPSADIATAVKVCEDAKIQYPAACNAIETMLIHKDIAGRFLPEMAETYFRDKVELRCDEAATEILKKAGLADKAAAAGLLKPAAEEDWDTEYNEMILSVMIIDSAEKAIDHINHHGSHHTDIILATDEKVIDAFTTLVDSADVMVNASSRFADGFRFGKGAEVGISTNKIHTRGPVGMEGLMIYKYILRGNGHIVADYEGGPKKYNHRYTNEKYCRLQ